MLQNSSPIGLIPRPELYRPVEQWIENGTRPAILLYRADGGYGKTTLNRQLIKVVCPKYPDLFYSCFDLQAFRTPEEFLWRLRDQFTFRSAAAQLRKLNFAFDRFDFCIDLIWRKIDPLTTRVDKAIQRRVAKMVEEGIDTLGSDGALDTAREYIGDDFSERVADYKWVKRFARPAFDSVRRTTTLLRYPDLKALEAETVDDLREHLITFFWQDIELELRLRPSAKVAFFIDNYHSLQASEDGRFNVAHSDIIEQVFQRPCMSLLVMFSRVRPLWWRDYELSSQRRSDDRFVGEIKEVSIREFSDTETQQYLTQFPDLTPEVRRLIAKDSSIPYLITQRTSLARIRVLEKMPVRSGDLAGARDELNERLLDCWTNDEQACLGVLNRIGEFNSEDFRSIVEGLRVNVSLSSYRRVFNASSIVESPDQPGMCRMHAFFSESVEKRMQWLEDKHDWLKKEAGWLVYTRLSERVPNDPIDLAGADLLIGAIDHLLHSTLDDRRWDIVEVSIRRITRALDIAETSGDPSAARVSFKFVHALFTILKNAGNRRNVKKSASAWFTRAIDQLSRLAVRRRQHLNNDSIERVAKIAENWCLMLDQAVREVLVEDSSRIEIDALWREKIRLNVEALRGEKLRKSSLHIARRVATLFERLTSLPEDAISLGVFAANTLSRRAKNDKVTAIEQRLQLYQSATALYKRICDHSSEASSILGRAVVALNPPDGAIIPRPLLDRLLIDLELLEKRFGSTDQILALKVRAIVRLAYHDRDDDKCSAGLARLETAEHFLHEAVRGREGVEKFWPARLLLRVFRKRAVLGGNPFNIDSDGSIFQVTVDYMALVGTNAIVAILGSWGKNRAGEADAISDHSMEHFCFVTSTLLGALAKNPELSTARETAFWVEKRVFMELDKYKDARGRLNASTHIFKRAFNLNNSGGSEFWKSFAPPTEVRELIARLTVEDSWNRMMLGEDVGHQEIADVYEKWINIARTGDRLKLKRILMEVLDRVQALDKREIKLQFALWSLAHGVSRRYLSDDLTVYKTIVEWGLDVLGDYIPESRASELRSELRDIKRGLRSDITVGSLTISARHWYSEEDRDHKNASRRLLFEAVAQGDKRLSTDDTARRNARRLFAISVWNEVWAGQFAQARGAPRLQAPRINEADLQQFMGGLNSNIEADLLLLLSRIPLRELLPGMRCVGIFKGVNCPGRDAELLFDVDGKEVRVRSSLVSVPLHHSLWAGSKIAESAAAPLGDDLFMRNVVGMNGRPVYLNILKDKDGVTQGTCRGERYVTDLFELVFPGGVVRRKSNGILESQMWMGASNSWAVVQMWPMQMTSFLAGGGWTTGWIASMAGLRRITITQGYSTAGPYRFWRELREFVNNSWSGLDIEGKVGNIIIVRTSERDLADLRKKRTFESMFSKVFEGYRVCVMPKQVESINTVLS
ncbi:hypothetical protein PQJ75_06900 [Rhodoplanes sp. TEM]|uniref:ATP-binding protein n=1 Tax=Rhodoplanes tepidamans TaxID=200616 RepID=A0ABT5J456_RHOTP|nr:MULTISPECIES: hypothetical protein [Rhodoplanes]MDC7784425.1 hypothetical protein [Rhodoplanes tepidamans]MDC7983455.1 hypothetical protein [Rhodoplanes sp. TEM]MDQ0356932.1 hypothetical protein [Rhodoplanes tepidamans]